MPYTILIAEDDADIRELLRLYLESSGHRILTAADGQEAWDILSTQTVHLAVLDVMMPRLDGFSLVRRLREVSTIPVLILSAKDQDADKILGLNLGADDYMTKPFNPLEIVARVQAALRRTYQLDAEQKPDTRLTIGDLLLDTETLTLQKAGKEIILTPSEYKILALLMRSPGRVYTKSQICEAINGEFYENYENAITVHISHLREKIEDDTKTPRYIKNVRGIGYRIEKQTP